MEFMLAKWEEQKGEARELKNKKKEQNDETQPVKSAVVVILKGLLKPGRYEKCFVTDIYCANGESFRDFHAKLV